MTPITKCPPWSARHGASPETTRTRPQTTEATASTSPSSTMFRKSESVQIRVHTCDQVISQQPASLVPRLESLPHISSSASPTSLPTFQTAFIQVTRVIILLCSSVYLCIRLDSGSDEERLPGVAPVYPTGVAALIPTLQY